MKLSPLTGVDIHSAILKSSEKHHVIVISKSLVRSDAREQRGEIPTMPG
jgi:hypothetical protein